MFVHFLHSIRYFCFTNTKLSLLASIPFFINIHQINVLEITQNIIDTMQEVMQKYFNVLLFY